MLLRVTAALVLALTASCMMDPNDSDTDSNEGDVSGATTYMDLFDFPKIDQGAWYDDISKLNAEFSATCSSTYCDLQRITPLSFACSVSSKEGIVHDCAWTFASAALEVEPTTAAIQTNAPTYQCHVALKTSAVKLAQFLSTELDPLHALPPGGGASINDQLAGCFAKPLGATPIVPGPQSPETYVAASAYYTSAASQKKWAAATAGLVLGFDNICGDTYCGSDFGNLTSLAFDCAITKSSGNIKSCAWVFAGSYNGVDQIHGVDAPTSKGFRCNVAVKGTLPQLITTLTGALPAGSPDPIDRALPGETTSAYDALDCLP